jgi:hypothetical protein
MNQDNTNKPTKVQMLTPEQEKEAAKIRQFNAIFEIIQFIVGFFFVIWILPILLSPFQGML